MKLKQLRDLVPAAGTSALLAQFSLSRGAERSQTCPHAARPSAPFLCVCLMGASAEQPGLCQPGLQCELSGPQLFARVSQGSVAGPLAVVQSHPISSRLK